jgi:hypothetical protein
MLIDLPLVSRYNSYMKQIPAVILMCLAGFFAFSCTAVDPARRYPNMVADADPVSAGSVEIVFDKLLSSKLNKVEVEAIFYPRLNAVALDFRYELIRYRQFWDIAGRLQFAAALERYKEDYGARKLESKYRKTRAAYGRVRGRVEWETFRFSKTYKAQPVIELGYRFRDGSPFFATLMRSTKEDDPSGDSPSMESRQINMYFTRAQAEQLVRLFDQDYLMWLLGKRGSGNPEKPPEQDDYYSEL